MKCANHPLNDAAVYCAHCGRPLCEACRRDVAGTIYCETCLAARLHSSDWPSVANQGFGGSPGVALVLGFIPGVGAVYNGQIIKAIVQVLIFGSLVALHHGTEWPFGGVFVLGAVAFYCYMIIDSYRTARAKQAGQPIADWFGPEHTKMNVPIGAALLIGFGILMLLHNFGIPVFGRIGRFWPVIWIAIGVLLLRRRTTARPLPPYSGPKTDQTDQPGSASEPPRI